MISDYQSWIELWYWSVGFYEMFSWGESCPLILWTCRVTVKWFLGYLRHVTWLLDPLPSRLLKIFHKLPLWKQTINYHPRTTKRQKTHSKQRVIPPARPFSLVQSSTRVFGFFRKNKMPSCFTNSTVDKQTQFQSHREKLTEPLAVSHRTGLSVGWRSTDKLWHLGINKNIIG